MINLISTNFIDFPCFYEITATYLIYCCNIWLTIDEFYELFQH